MYSMPDYSNSMKGPIEKSPYNPRRASVNVAATLGSGGSVSGGRPTSSGYDKRSFCKKDSSGGGGGNHNNKSPRRRASVGGADRHGGVMLAPTIDFSKLSNSLNRDRMEKGVDDASVGVNSAQQDDNTNNDSIGAQQESGGGGSAATPSAKEISSGVHGRNAFSCTGEHKKDGTNHDEFNPNSVLHLLDYGDTDTPTTTNSLKDALNPATMVVTRRASVATGSSNARYQTMTSMYSSKPGQDGDNYDHNNNSLDILSPEGLAAAIKNKPKGRIRRTKSFDPDASFGSRSVASAMGEEEWKQFRRQSLAAKMNPHFGGGPKRSRMGRKASMDLTPNGMGGRQGINGSMMGGKQSLKAKMEQLASSGIHDRKSNVRGNTSTGDLDAMMDASDRKATTIRSRGSTGNLDSMMDSSNRNNGIRAGGNSGRLDAMMDARERKLGVKRNNSRSSKRSINAEDITQSEHNPRRQSHDIRHKRSSSDPDCLKDGSDDEDGLQRCNTQGSKSSLKEPVQRSIEGGAEGRKSSLKEALLSPQKKCSDKPKRKSSSSLTSMVATPPEGLQLRKASSAARLAGLATNTPVAERKTRSSSKTRSPSRDRVPSTPRRSSRKSVGSSSPSKDAAPKTPKTPGKRRQSSSPKKSADGSDSFNHLALSNSHNDITGNPPVTATTAATTTRRHNPAETWICDCGYELRLIMKFCGMCASPQNWTCADCGFDQNLHAFRFCGNCATPKTVQSATSSIGTVEKPKAMKLISPNSVAIGDLDTSDESTME